MQNVVVNLNEDFILGSDFFCHPDNLGSIDYKVNCVRLRDEYFPFWEKNKNMKLIVNCTYEQLAKLKYTTNVTKNCDGHSFC